MAKIGGIIDFIESGLKAENLRQKAIANNVANLNTPGYRRLDVQFKELLAKAMDSSGKVNPNDIEALLYQPENTKINPNGNDVNLEAEVGAMIKNTLRHKTYVRILQKKYQQMNLAITVK